MLEWLENEEKAFIEIVVSGEVTREGFYQIAEGLQERVLSWGHLRVLQHVKSFGHSEPEAFWGDMKAAFGRFGQTMKLAIVADSRWTQYLTEEILPGMKIQGKHFGPSEIDEAKQWLLTE